MDLVDTVYLWNEALVPASLGADRWLLLSERDAWLFDDRGFTGVATAIEQGVPLAALCRNEHLAWNMPSVLQALHALAAQGHVRALGSARPDEARFAAPDTMAEPRRQAIGEPVDVINLSCGVDDDAALDAARQAAAPALTIVFCDDLLDPRLAAVDREQRAVGRDWLLVKATGRQRLAGLLRGGGALNGACWHCLTQRCLHNRPVRAWWQARCGAWPRVPVRCEASWVADGLNAARAWLPRLLAQRMPHLLVFDEAEIGGAPVPHAIVPSPACPCCSVPWLMAERQWQLPSLDPRAPIERVPPAQTVERLRPYVSDLCGIVSHLSRLDASSHPAAPAIYRSGFFRTLRLDDAPFERPLSRLCLGKGASDAQAQASALCEAMERYAACWQGDEAAVVGAADALDAPAFLPQQLQPSAAAVDRTTPMCWAPAWSLTRNARCYLPLGFCYAQAPAEEAGRIGWNSNGCAAGNTLEEAILSGFLELVERDAVALWWYNRIGRPEAPVGPGAARIGDAFGAAWERWLLDLTHDFGIPVVAAIARHRNRGDWLYGFGSGASLAEAGERAMAELLQLVCVDKRMAPPADGAAALRFLLPSPGAARCGAPRIVERVDHCVAAASARGLEMIMLDYTRPDIPLHTVKIVVPGLSHIWPGWTTSRLHQVPVTLGWLDRKLAPDELNPQPLFL